MKQKPRLHHPAIVMALAALLVSPTAAQNKPAFVGGSIVLYSQPGTSLANVQTLAATVNATQVTPLLLADCYKLTLSAAKADSADTLAAVATLKPSPMVRSVHAERIFHTSQSGTGAATMTPNDPYYVNGSQWALPLINMPEAWVLQRGKNGVNLCDIDSGFDPTHPDLLNQYLTDSYNWADGNTNIQYGVGPDAQHGVFTSSIMIALTNNAAGMSAVCWQGTKCLGYVVSQAADTTGALVETAVLNSEAAAVTNKLKDGVVAVNESFGTGDVPGFNPNDPTDPDFISHQNMDNAGIIVCIAAGNDSGDDSTAIPAGIILPLSLTVSAVNRKAQLTYYSSFGKVDVAAPGGEQFSDADPGGILGANSGAYAFEQGTSFAAPHTTALATLMMSAPSNPTPAAVVGFIKSTANHSITGQASLPDPKYGYGLIDAYQALLRVSFDVVIVTPNGVNPVTGLSTDPTGLPPAPVETLNPQLQFQVNNIPLSNINITLQNSTAGTTQIVTNGVANQTLVAQHVISNFAVSGVSTGTNPQYTISFNYRFNQTLPSQQQTILITGQPSDTTVPAVSDTRVFTVAPFQFPSGLSLISIPYYESASASPSGALRDFRTITSSSDAILYRWVQVASKYATNGLGSSDFLPNVASLHPTNTVSSNPENSLSDVTPLGLGYFLQSASASIFRTYGFSLPIQYANSGQPVNVHVPLLEGWNLIGDPFPFEVSFDTTQIQTANGTRLAIGDAATAGLVLPYLYSLVGGEYTFAQFPGGTLVPWQGNWIFVVPKNANNLNPNPVLTLIIPPTGYATSEKSVKAATTGQSRAVSTAKVTGSGSWSLQLAAQGGRLADSHNFIGMSANATDGNDLTKAPKPPMMSPYVSLGMVRSAGTLYAQDLRSLGKAETWNVLVSTDQPNINLSVVWPTINSVPRSVKLTLTDPVTGQTINMRNQGSYQFHTDKTHQTRSLTITATPGSDNGRVLITGLFVNPSPSSRGAGQSIYEVNYNLSGDANVDVSIIGSGGRIVGTAQTSRAATEGANSAVWDGRDVKGRQLPSGAYEVQVRAVTPDGEVTRQTYPLTIIR